MYQPFHLPLESRVPVPYAFVLGCEPRISRQRRICHEIHARTSSQLPTEAATNSQRIFGEAVSSAQRLAHLAHNNHDRTLERLQKDSIETADALALVQRRLSDAASPSDIGKEPTFAVEHSL